MTAATRLLLTVISLFTLAGIGYRRASPPSPLDASAPPAEFAAGRAHEVLGRLLGNGSPHPVGSPEHAALRERVLSELRRVGLTPWVEEAFACSPHGSCASVRNILAEVPGREAGKSVLLVAHYDSVGAGSGAGDDAASVAAVVEVARALREVSRRNSVLLLIDDGEEPGLLGAEAFVRTRRAASIGAVVNLEARGDTGPSLLFETGSRNAWLVRTAVARMPRPVTSSIFAFVYDRLPNDTDLTVFKREGLQGVNLAFIGSPSRYHTPQDSLANLSLATLQHHGENALALTTALANAELAAMPEGRAVFFDVLGLLVVSWPQSLSVPLALLGLLLVRLAARRAGLSPMVGWRHLAPSLSSLAAAAAGAAVWQVLRLLGAFPLPFVARPWPSVLAAAFAGLAAAILVLVRERRHPTPDGGWERTWTNLSLLGILLAALAPDFCYLLVGPALVAGICGLVLRPRWAVWLPFGALGLLVLPIVLRLPEALGPVALPVVAFAFGLGLSTAAPFVDHAGRPFRTAGILAALTVLAGAVSLLAPASTPDLPEHGPLQAYLSAAPASDARLLYRPSSRRLSPALRQAARFELGTGSIPWAPRVEAFSASLSTPAPAGPRLSVDGSVPQADGSRRLTLHVSSASQAGPMNGTLGLYAMGGGRDVLVNGVPLARPYLRNPRPQTGPLYLTFRGMQSGVVTVELTVPAKPAPAYLVEVTPGLPAEAEAVRAARPPNVSTVGGGDTTTVWRRLEL